MAYDTPDGRQTGGLSPQSLRLEDMARILSTFGPKPVTVELLQADIDDGAPVNRDGTLNLLHYCAWLAFQMLHGTD